MTHQLWLTEDEIQALTGRINSTARIKALNSMGIQYRINSAGQLIVGRKHVEDVLSGGGTIKPEKPEPRFNRLEKGAA